MPVSNSTTQSGLPTSNLVGEWKFESNTLDTSGNGNNGILGGGASYVAGKIGQALQFDGNTGVASITNSPSLNFGSTGSFSISLWMKSTQSGTGNAGFGWLVDHRSNNDGTYAGYTIGDGSGTIQARIRDSSGHDVPVFSTTNVNDNKFHHIVFVVDRSAQMEQLYVDDALQSSASTSSVGSIGTYVNLHLGGTADPNTPVNFFAGTLDQVRIYNRILTNSEIFALYNETGSTPVTPPSPPHLFAYSGNAQVDLSWSEPSSNGGSPVTNYNIYRGTSQNSETLLKQVGNVLTYIDNAVTNGQTYYYYITAVNSAGQSPASNEISATPMAPNSTGASIPRNGLVAEWKFENNAFDTSGNRNDGVTGTVSFVYGGCCPKVRSVVTPGPGIYYPGKIGMALGFNGTDIDRVANSASLNFGSGSLSISGWIKTNQTSFWLVEHRRDNDGVYAGYSLEGSNGTMLGRIRDSGAHEVYVRTSSINDNQFHHVAFVVDRSTQTMRIYLDNKLQALAGISQVGSIDQNSIGVDIGYTASPNTPNSPLVGAVDQVRIYNRVITDNEIQSLFLENPLTGQPTAPQNLVAKSGNNQVSLSWSAPSNSGNTAITNYNIYRGTASGRETFLAQTGNIPSYIDNTATNGQRYFYEVTAVNSGGESTTSNEVSVVPASIPSAPHIVLSSACNTEVDLNWAAPNNGGSAITNYTIYRGTAAGTEALLAEIGNVASYTDASVINGHTYYYYIKAVNAVGQSAASNEVNATPTNSTSCMPIAGLVGEWKFESNTLDTSGNGNNGILSGGASYVAGKVGQALQFDGNTGVASITNSPSLNFGSTGSFSISLWMKSTQSGTGNAGFGWLVDHRSNNDGTYAGYTIGDGSGTIQARIRDSSGHDVPVISTSNVNNGTFHHIVFVVDRSTQIEHLYVDGVLQSSASISSVGSIDTSLDVHLGGTAIPNTLVNFFAGTLDQVRIYNLALTDSQIRSLYEESGPSKVTNSIAINNVRSTSGTASTAGTVLSSNQVTIPNFNAGTASNSLLLVGVSANNNSAVSVTFRGMPLTSAVSSFYNNDAEFWYLKGPSGTGDIVVTMGGPAQVVVGAYSFSGVNQTDPIPTSAAIYNTAPGSPAISITTKYANDLVLDLPSIYGGSTLGSPTCTQQWNANVPSEITGASSSAAIQPPAAVTCKWTASSADLWDDVAVELNAAR